ncbi:hypothetical protein ACWDA8_45225, partial [Streptomyces sp. NPDC001130]
MPHYGPDNPDATYVPHAYPQARFDTGEIMLNHATTGSTDKPALVLIPPQATSWWSYEAAMKLLADGKPTKNDLCRMAQVIRSTMNRATDVLAEPD